ncbi:MAG TPA: transketolase C-terminal domain-containing protein [Trebonia sp.]|jgi:transketolase|nr:transketolase C-terminal domain-containing protein [Trebonia sp.]
MPLDPPYETILKPYGQALVRYAAEHPEVICLGADLTRQTETDLFRDDPRLASRFFNGGMAEQNLMGVAAGLAREGHTVFVNTFGVFATRRPFEQVTMQIAYANLGVKIVGLMPGLSSPGGPSHQATDDVALMRALPNFTVVDVADAREVTQAVAAVAQRPGPVYLRLKRGEIPVIFEEGHRLDLDRAALIDPDPGRAPGGVDSVIFASGMLVASALRAAQSLRRAGMTVDVVNVTTIKPLDAATVRALAGSARCVVTAENHSVIGGLGSAVAEVLAEAGYSPPMRRVGILDTFGRPAASARSLFAEYGLTAQHIVDVAWKLAGRDGDRPVVTEIETTAGSYSPV